MAWRLARSLETLAAEVLARHPGTTVWTIGDAAHRATASDHNPNRAGVVCASDTLSDGGLDLGWYAEQVVRSGHPALKYVIYDRRVWSRARAGEGWRPYSGSNPHTGHVHVSVGIGPDGRSTGPYDDTSPWGLAQTGEDDMLGLSRGDGRATGDYQRVVALQHTLQQAGFVPAGGVDGEYGPATAAAVLACRRSVGSKATSGDQVDGWTWAQVMRAVAERRAQLRDEALAAALKRAIEAAVAQSQLPSTIVIDLPDTITVPVEPAGNDAPAAG